MYPQKCPAAIGSIARYFIVSRSITLILLSLFFIFTPVLSSCLTHIIPHYSKQVNSKKSAPSTERIILTEIIH